MSASKKAFLDDRRSEEVNQSEMLHRSYSDVTKQSIAREVDRFRIAVENGEADPLKALAYLKGVEKVVKDSIGKIMPHALDEFQKYKGEKAITVLTGCKVEEMEGGVNYDYSNTDKWTEIKAKENLIAKERKELESTLKTLKKPLKEVDEDTGELIVLNPAIRTSTTTLKVTIK